MVVFEGGAVQSDETASSFSKSRLTTSLPWRMTASQIVGLVFLAALAQFAIYTWQTLNQPILDMWGFRPAQTAASVPYMLHDRQWLATIVPVFGEPWILVLEFPLYQWCVAFLAEISGISIDSCGRLVSAFFAVATIWPVFLLAQSVRLGRRFVLIVGTLWLLAPLIIFWGRTFLIETTVVFLGACWLAFYIRFFTSKRHADLVVSIIFGVLAALVKITGFAPFVVVGFIYTCAFVWQQRSRIPASLTNLVLAASTIVLPAIAFSIWRSYSDHFMAQNPIANQLRSQNLVSWYFGEWSDRSSTALWDWAVRRRVLPETLGAAWFVALYSLARVGPRNQWFWVTLSLLVGFLSVFLFFPILQMIHPYYNVESAILVCAAVGVTTEALLRSGRKVEGYIVLAIIMAGQLWSFYTGFYYNALTSDLRQHPYYLASSVVKNNTHPDSVVVGFGMGFGADVPYFSDRRGVILANGFSIPAFREVLFEHRDRWLGRREVGAVVDCKVFSSQAISPSLKPILEELKREISGKMVQVTGTVYGADISPQECDVFLAAK